MKFRLEQTLFAVALAGFGALKAVRLTLDAIDDAFSPIFWSKQ